MATKITNDDFSFDNIMKNKLTGEALKFYNNGTYGREDHCEIKLQNKTVSLIEEDLLQVRGYAFHAAKEHLRRPRIVKIGLIQHSIVLDTNKPIAKQREAIYSKVQNIIELAALENVQIVCLQETWPMPFFLCTGEKTPWSEFAEDAENGPSTSLLRELAKKHKMVIISPILEIDEGGKWWNTAVIIDDEGKVMGKHRKNHLPSVGSFSETNFYKPGNTGHPVFDTKYGKIAVNICYGRHQALNWLMFRLNGAEVVFNPAATVAEFGESFWTVEARNAAVANGYFTCSINRVGSEEFRVLKDSVVDKVTRTYYGSSYITAPDGCRTPCLSRFKDGLLIAKVDLNLCRQVRDRWGFNMTGRLELYAKELQEFTQLNKEKQE